MSRWDKLLSRILSLSQDLRFSELQKLVKAIVESEEAI